MEDVSVNTLDGVRKNLSTVSFLVIVYFFIDASLITDKFKLSLLNVHVNKPENLIMVLWALMAWWVFRYFQTGAYRVFKEDFEKEVVHVLISPKTIVGEALFVADIIEDENLPSYKVNVGLFRLKKIVFKIAPDDRYKQFKKDKGLWFIKWQVILTYPSHITFLLPLIMVSVAFYLTNFFT